MTTNTATIVDKGSHLEIAWGDNTSAKLSSAVLWLNSRSAASVRDRIEGRHVNPPAALTITTVTPVGHYGVNIAFSDGRDRGIYPWVLLSEIAARPTAQDFIIPTANPSGSRLRPSHTSGVR